MFLSNSRKFGFSNERVVGPIASGQTGSREFESKTRVDCVGECLAPRSRFYPLTSPSLQNLLNEVRESVDRPPWIAELSREQRHHCGLLLAQPWASTRPSPLINTSPGVPARSASQQRNAILHSRPVSFTQPQHHSPVTVSTSPAQRFQSSSPAPSAGRSSYDPFSPPSPSLSPPRSAGVPLPTQSPPPSAPLRLGKASLTDTHTRPHSQPELLPIQRVRLIEALAPGAQVHGVVVAGGRPEAPTIRVSTAYPLRSSPPPPPTTTTVSALVPASLSPSTPSSSSSSQPADSSRQSLGASSQAEQQSSRPQLHAAYRVCQTVLPSFEAAHLVSVCARRSDGRRYREGDLVSAQILRTEPEHARLVLGPARSTDHALLLGELADLERAVAGIHSRCDEGERACSPTQSPLHSDAASRARSREPQIRTRRQNEKEFSAQVTPSSAYRGYHGNPVARSPLPRAAKRFSEPERSKVAYNDRLDELGVTRNPGMAEVLRRSFGLQQHGTLLGGERGLLRADQPSLHYGVLRRRQYRRWADETVQRGVALAKKGRMEAALKLYKEALTTCPDHADALVARGAAYANLGRLVEAVNEFREALRVDPQHANAVRYLNTCRDRLSQSSSMASPLSAADRTSSQHEAHRTDKNVASTDRSSLTKLAERTTSSISTSTERLQEKLRRILSDEDRKRQRKRKRRERDHRSSSPSRRRERKSSSRAKEKRRAGKR